jgi:hypothetical protein
MVAQRSFWLPPAVGFGNLEVTLLFLVQRSSSEFLSVVCSACEASSYPGSMLLS